MSPLIVSVLLIVTPLALGGVLAWVKSRNRPKQVVEFGVSWKEFEPPVKPQTQASPMPQARARESLSPLTTLGAER